MPQIVTKVAVEIQGKLYSVVGDDFSEILDAVKSVPGRKWGESLGRGKVWILPGTLEECKSLLTDYKICTDSELISVEADEIAKIKQEVLDRQQEIRDLLAETEQAESKYTTKFGARAFQMGRNQARLGRNIGCLRYALEHAVKPVEQLTEPEIATLRRTIRLINGEE